MIIRRNKRRIVTYDFIKAVVNNMTIGDAFVMCKRQAAASVNGIHKKWY